MLFVGQWSGVSEFAVSKLYFFLDQRRLPVDVGLVTVSSPMKVSVVNFIFQNANWNCKSTCSFSKYHVNPGNASVSVILFGNEYCHFLWQSCCRSTKQIPSPSSLMNGGLYGSFTGDLLKVDGGLHFYSAFRLTTEIFFICDDCHQSLWLVIETMWISQ